MEEFVDIDKNVDSCDKPSGKKVIIKDSQEHSTRKITVETIVSRYATSLEEQAKIKLKIKKKEETARKSKNKMKIEDAVDPTEEQHGGLEHQEHAGELQHRQGDVCEVHQQAHTFCQLPRNTLYDTKES